MSRICDNSTIFDRYYWESTKQTTWNCDNTGLATPTLCKRKIQTGFTPGPLAEVITETVSEPTRKDQ